MEHNQPGTNPMQEARRIAATPAGQELIRHLQRSGGTDLKQAMEKAAAGDYSAAKAAISALLKDPEAKKLMEQLGR